MLTIDCVVYNNSVGFLNDSCNGVTTHNSRKAPNIGGVYYGNKGGNVAIANVLTEIWCVGTSCYGSFGDIPVGPTDYHIVGAAAGAAIYLGG